MLGARKNSNEIFNNEIFNNDVLLCIFKLLPGTGKNNSIFLDPIDLAAIMFVCKNWNSIARSNPLWVNFTHPQCKNNIIVNNNNNNDASVNSNDSYFSIWRKNIYARTNIFYCVGDKLKLNASASFDLDDLKNAFSNNLFPVFTNLENAIKYADLNPLLWDDNTSSKHDKFACYSPIFVVQCNHFDGAEPGLILDSIMVSPMNFSWVYEVQYKSGGKQAQPTIMVIPPSHRQQLITDIVEQASELQQQDNKPKFIAE